MNLRRFFAIFSLILLGGILVACGTDDDPEPPVAEAPTIEPADIETEDPTEPAVEEDVLAPVFEEDATPEATPEGTPVATPDILATPAVGEATPVADEDEVIEATPEIEGVVAATPAVDEVIAATPEVDEVIAATPEVDGVIAATPETDDDGLATPEADATPVPMNELSGTLTLDGRQQQDFTLSPEGCVGLGEWRQLAPGAQVVVRDASGTVVDIAELEATDSEDECMWTFSLQAPGEDYFSVRIAMVTEVWFEQDDAGVQNGEIEMFVP